MRREWDSSRGCYIWVEDNAYPPPQQNFNNYPPPQPAPTQNPWDQEDRIRDRIRRDEDERKRQEKIAIEEYERRKQREEEEKEEAEKKAVEKYQQKKKDEKDAEERAWKEHERKKKEEKEKADEQYRKRVEEDFGRYGFQKDQIDQMIDPEARKNSNTALARTTSNKFLRIRRKDVEIETLQAFNVPWGYDPKNSDYYVIYKEMSFEETDEMFDHTKRLRRKQRSPKMLEAKPRNVVVRERSRSRNRSKSPGLREKFAAKVAGID